MARPDDEPQPTAVPSSPPPLPLESTDPSVEIYMPNLNRVSAATFRRGTLSRRRVNIALGILLAIAVLTTALVLFAEIIVANLGTILQWAFFAALVIGVVGVIVIRRDEQRTRRSARRHDDDDG